LGKKSKGAGISGGKRGKPGGRTCEPSNEIWDLTRPNGNEGVVGSDERFGKVETRGNKKIETSSCGGKSGVGGGNHLGLPGEKSWVARSARVGEGPGARGGGDHPPQKKSEETAHRSLHPTAQSL